MQNTRKQIKKQKSEETRQFTFKDLLDEVNTLKKHQHSPKVDLSESVDQVIVRMEVPGMNHSSLKLQLRDAQILLVSGVRPTTSPVKFTLIYSECSYGNFMRRVKLPTLVYDQYHVHIEDGVLNISFNKQVKHDVLDSRLEDAPYIDYSQLASGTCCWADM